MAFFSRSSQPAREPEPLVPDDMLAPNALIGLRNIEKSYAHGTSRTYVLRRINVDVKEGEFVSIMGPSGCGKSTLLNVLGLIDKPTGGEVRFGGRNVGGLDDGELAPMRNRELGFVFQQFHLIPDLRVLDNVELPLLYRKCSGAERRKLALKALEIVGLERRIHHFPTELSGGQQQRVAVARAIVGRPNLLLADEPTGNLDSRSGEEVFEMMREMNRESGVAFVMITHDDRLAQAADRILLIEDGLIHEISKEEHHRRILNIA
jgi:putative ABC transport system ATP-binding protein